MDVSDRQDVGAPEDKSRPTKARKAKSATRAPADQGGKRSLNLRIDEDCYERLHVHALRRRVTVSELVMDLTRAGCRDFHIARSPGGAARAEEGAA